MDTTTTGWTDERLETLLGNVLRWGVVSAGGVVALGAVVYLARHGSEPPQYQVFRGEPSDLKSVGGILLDVFDGRGRGLIQFGLLLLIATPISRVVLSMVAFALQHDRRYVVITLIVLVVLLYSLFGPYF
jgi:uncharacterized membrane protein